MVGKEADYPRAWITKADADLRAAEKLLINQEFSTAAFHIQQAIEKYLKGCLLYCGWSLRRLHDLETLLNEAVTHVPTLEQFRELCAVATEYYIAERYPYEDTTPTDNKLLEQQIVQVKALRKHILGMALPLRDTDEP